MGVRALPQPGRLTLRRRIPDLAVALFALAALAGAAWLTNVGATGVHTADGEALGTLCWVRGLLGFDCPFCGMTRSFVALAHGDLAGSLAFHPAGPLMMGWLAVALLWIVVAAARREPPVFMRARFSVSLQAVAAVSVAAGLLRSLAQLQVW